MSVSTSVGPDKESVYFQGSLAQMQSRQFTEITRDNVTFLQIVQNEPIRQSYTDPKEFNEKISSYSFLSNKFIYKKVIDDARVIPDDIVIKNRMDEYFSPRFYKNIQRLYQNAPLYFEYLFSKEAVAEQRHKQYSIYIYALCLIEYIMKHHTSSDFQLIKGHQLYYEWALPKYSEQVSYIIKGPLSKSSSIKIDFKKHYASIMNPANTEGDVIPFLQLASLQNLDAKLSALNHFLSIMPNPYDKLADHARTYNLLISALKMHYYNEPVLNNTIVIDLRGSDFGNADEAIKQTPTLDSIVTTMIDISSRLSLHKLQELFNDYSRIRISNFEVDYELYKVPLDFYTQCDLVMKGVEVASRSVAIIDKNNNSTNDGLTIPGSFIFDTVKRVYRFQPSLDVITYDPRKVRVTDARLYLAHDGIPIAANNITSSISNEDIYNVIFNCYTKPIPTNIKSVRLYTFSTYTISDTIVHLDDALIEYDGSLAYVRNMQGVNSSLQDGQIRTYKANQFTLYANNDNEFHLNDWDIQTVDGVIDMFTDAGIPLTSGYVDNALGSLFIVLAEPGAESGYIYKYNAELNDVVWSIEDYYRSILAIHDPIIDEVFEPTNTYDDLENDISDANVIDINNARVVILVKNYTTGESSYYVFDQCLTYNQQKVKLYLTTYGMWVVSFDNNNHSIEDMEIEFRDEIVTVLAQKINPTTRLPTGYTVEDLSAFRLMFHDDTTMYRRNGLIYIPPLSALSALFTPVTEEHPWFDMQLSTNILTDLYTSYIITSKVPMLYVPGYRTPNIAIYDSIDLEGTGAKPVNIVEQDTNHDPLGVVLLTDQWRSLAVMNVENYITLSIDTKYAIEYDYYDAFELGLEFS